MKRLFGKKASMFYECSVFSQFFLLLTVGTRSFLHLNFCIHVGFGIIIIHGATITEFLAVKEAFLSHLFGLLTVGTVSYYT